MSGRDVVLFGLMGSEPAKIFTLPIPGPYSWVETWVRRGILKRTSTSHAQIIPQEFAQACEHVLAEFPRFDRVCQLPTQIEILASLPHRRGGIAEKTATFRIDGRSRALQSLEKHGFVSRSFSHQKLVAPKSILALITAYRNLYRALPLETKDSSAICLHQYGVEAAWSLSKSPGKRAVAYRGLRRLHPVDAVLLNWRMRLNLTTGCPLSRNKLPQEAIDAAARHLPLNVVTCLAFRDRLAFYGLEVLQKPLELASDDLRFKRGTVWNLTESFSANLAPFKEQRALRWVPEPN